MQVKIRVQIFYSQHSVRWGQIKYIEKRIRFYLREQGEGSRQKNKKIKKLRSNHDGVLVDTAGKVKL